MNKLIFLLLFLFSVMPVLTRAQVLSSSDFQVQHAVIAPASYGTSTSFRLLGVLGQPVIGTSTSAGFGLNAGFLFFPLVTTPTLAAAAGVQKADLSWTASQGFLGFSVLGYQVGQSTVAGGPYTITSLGNVLSSSRTGLTGGTTYYFIIRVLDAFSNVIATSTEVSAVPSSPVVVPPPVVPPVGGGGGGAAPNASTTVATTTPETMAATTTSPVSPVGDTSASSTPETVPATTTVVDPVVATSTVDAGAAIGQTASTTGSQ